MTGTFLRIRLPQEDIRLRQRAVGAASFNGFVKLLPALRKRQQK